MKTHEPNTLEDIFYSDTNSQLLIGDQAFIFYKPLRIGTITISSWRSNDYSGNQLYGYTLYQQGKILDPRMDERFLDIVIDQSACSFNELVEVIERIRGMFTENQIVVLDYS